MRTVCYLIINLWTGSVTSSTITKEYARKCHAGFCLPAVAGRFTWVSLIKANRCDVCKSPSKERQERPLHSFGAGPYNYKPPLKIAGTDTEELCKVVQLTRKRLCLCCKEGPTNVLIEIHSSLLQTVGHLRKAYSKTILFLMKIKCLLFRSKIEVFMKLLHSHVAVP